MKRILSILFLVVVFTSCEKTFTTIVDIQIPHTPEMSVECANFPEIDSTIFGLKATKGLSDTGYCPVISNAVVQLYENDVLMSTMTYYANSGIYSTPFTAYTAGKTYTVKASAPGYPAIEASDIMPSTPGNFQVEHIENALKMNFQGSPDAWFDEFKISFDDQASTQDFYAINIDNSIENLLQSNDMWTRGKYTVDPDVDANAGGDIGDNANIYYNKVYLTDKNFNGKRKTIVLYVENGMIGPTPQPNFQPWFLRFDNLSENAYKYEKTKWLYQMSDGNPFAEPVLIHNNVKNGVGSFRLMKTILDTL